MARPDSPTMDAVAVLKTRHAELQASRSEALRLANQADGPSQGIYQDAALVATVRLQEIEHLLSLLS